MCDRSSLIRSSLTLIVTPIVGLFAINIGLFHLNLAIASWWLEAAIFWGYSHTLSKEQAFKRIRIHTWMEVYHVVGSSGAHEQFGYRRKDREQQSVFSAQFKHDLPQA